MGCFLITSILIAMVVLWPKEDARLEINLSWVILCVLTMVLIALTIGLFSTTIGLNEFCNTFDEFRTEEDEFSTFNNSVFFPEEITTNI